MIVRIGTNEYQSSITERSDMTDTYLNFANSPFGAKLAETLGLPKPLKLERYKPGQPVIKGTVLVGGHFGNAVGTGFVIGCGQAHVAAKGGYGINDARIVGGDIDLIQ